MRQPQPIEVQTPKKTRVNLTYIGDNSNGTVFLDNLLEAGTVGMPSNDHIHRESRREDASSGLSA
jgi:hypothetical protein